LHIFWYGLEKHANHSKCDYATILFYFNQLMAADPFPTAFALIRFKTKLLIEFAVKYLQNICFVHVSVETGHNKQPTQHNAVPCD
jgi:hypothetical protein